MHLMYFLGDDGKRVYTLKKSTPDGAPTVSAHPGKDFLGFSFLLPQFSCLMHFSPFVNSAILA